MKRNLATMDRDIFQGLGRLVQEAFAHGITNDMLFGGLESGQTTVQGVQTQQATKNCSIGSRLVTFDGRVYRYSRTNDTTVLNSDLLAQAVTAQHMGYTTIAAAALAGASTVVVDFGASDGAAGDGVLAANELENGYLLVFPHSENSFTRLITANTAVAAGGGECTLTLNKPLPVALTVDTDHCEAICSPYWRIKASTTGDVNKAFIGLPSVAAAANYYSWLQTWGPCWAAPQANVGSAAHSTQVVARYDGSIQVHDNSDTAVDGDLQQHIGFVMSRGAGAAQGAPFIMLQISC
jgi:hypothetical protein